MQRYIKYDGLMAAITSDYIKEKKSWLLYFLMVVLIFLSLAYLVYLKLSPYNLKEKLFLTVTSNYPIPDKATLETKAFWEIDLQEIRKNLLKSSAIKKVQVKLVLPNHLYINIVKREGLALWWDYKKFYLIDKEAVIIEEVSNKEKGKILVVGDKALEKFHKILPILDKSPLSHEISSIRFIGQRRWDLLLNNGILIKLPEKDLDEAIKLFIKLNKEGLVPKKSSIDMRLAPKKIFIKNVQDKR